MLRLALLFLGRALSQSRRDILYRPEIADATMGKVSTDRQYKKFSSTDEEFFCTVGI